MGLYDAVLLRIEHPAPGKRGASAPATVGLQPLRLTNAHALRRKNRTVSLIVENWQRRSRTTRTSGQTSSNTWRRYLAATVFASSPQPWAGLKASWPANLESAGAA